MKRPVKIIKEALTCVTQCVLLPGVELNIDDVVVFYKKNFGILSFRVKHITSRSSMSKS